MVLVARNRRDDICFFPIPNMSPGRALPRTDYNYDYVNLSELQNNWNDQTRERPSRGLGFLVSIVLLFAFLITFCFLIVELVQSKHRMRACPGNWFGHRGRCWYFSEVESSWASASNDCLTQRSRLAIVPLERDRNFTQNFGQKHDYWVGLKRGPMGMTWEDDTVYSGVHAGTGNCGYITKEGQIAFADCSMKRRWLCLDERSSVLKDLGDVFGNR